MSFLTSASSTMHPRSVSIKNILPGSSLPEILISAGSISRTPTSEDITTNPSLVTMYLAGLKPFLSKTAPIFLPSVKAMAAGPSHGSIKHALY